MIVTRNDSTCLVLLQRLALKINKVKKTVLSEGRSKMSEQSKPKDAEDILSEFDSRIKSSTEQPTDKAHNPSSPELNETSDQPTQTSEQVDQTSDQPTQTSEQTSLEENTQASEQVDQTSDQPTQTSEQTSLEENTQAPTPEIEKSNDNSNQSTETEEQRNVIFIGSKPLMAYVSATLTQLSTCPTVIIKARGRKITQAVDVSQMILKRMNAVGYIISDVRISSMSLASQDGKTRNVSTIEIDISKD